MSEIIDRIRSLNYRKKRSIDLVYGLRQDLQKLGISGDLEKQILASVLNRVNDYLDGEGANPLSISGIPERTTAA